MSTTRLLDVCLVGALLIGVASHTQAQICADQFFIPTSGNGLEVTNNQSVQQTFTVGMSGQLVEIELADMRHHRGISTFDLIFELVSTTANGTPTSFSLGRVVIPPTALTSTPTPLRIDLRPFHISVLPGEVLALHLETQSPSNGATYAWAGDAPASYGRGETWIQTNLGPLSFDMGFTTFVVTNTGLMLDLSQPDGPRSLRLRNLGGTPGEFFILALSFNTGNAPPNMGRGPWGGLYISVTDLLAELEVGAPFVGIFDAQGRSSVSYPAPIVPNWLVSRTVWGGTRHFDASRQLFRANSPIEALLLR
jgi:hypothetical protein